MEEGKHKAVALEICVILPIVTGAKELVAVVEPVGLDGLANGQINTHWQHVLFRYLCVEMVVDIVVRQCAGQVNTKIVLYVGAIHPQIAYDTAFLVVELAQPYDDVCVISIGGDDFVAYMLSFGIIDFGLCRLERLFLVGVPDEEAYGELTFHVVEGVGRNQEESTGLCPERLAEFMEVGSLHYFQL